MRGAEFAPEGSIAEEELIAALSQAAAALRGVLPPKVETPASSGTFQGKRIRSASALTLAFREVASLNKLLHRLPENISPELTASLAEYRRLLEELRSQLPECYGWLLAERQRLGQRRSHSSAVEAWIQTSNQTR